MSFYDMLIFNVLQHTKTFGKKKYNGSFLLLSIYDVGVNNHCYLVTYVLILNRSKFLRIRAVKKRLHVTASKCKYYNFFHLLAKKNNLTIMCPRSLDPCYIVPNLLYKMGQDLLDIQYLFFDVELLPGVDDVNDCRGTNFLNLLLTFYVNLKKKSLYLKNREPERDRLLLLC